MGIGDGQLQGFTMVVWNVQSERAQVLWQLRFCMVRVAVGQLTASGASARARLARQRRAERAASFIVEVGLLACLLGGECCLSAFLFFLPLPGLVGWRSTVPGSRVVDGACLLGGWLSCSTLLRVEQTGTPGYLLYASGSGRPPSFACRFYSGLQGVPVMGSLLGCPLASPESCLFYGING